MCVELERSGEVLETRINYGTSIRCSILEYPACVGVNMELQTCEVRHVLEGFSQGSIIILGDDVGVIEGDEE